ncbi:MAG: GGDEF domain-containing protein [Pseudomonadota bacterium]
MHNDHESSRESLWSSLRHNFSETFSSGELLRERRVLGSADDDELTARRRRDAYRYIMLLVILVLAPVNFYSFRTGDEVSGYAGLGLLSLLLLNFWLLSQGRRAAVPLGAILILTIGVVFLSVVYGASYSVYWLYPLLVALPVLLDSRLSIWIAASCALIAFPIAFTLYPSIIALILCLSLALTWLVSSWLVYAVSLQSRRLREIAVTDPLTGAYNRRYFEQQADRALENWIRHQRPASLLLIDIDFFKRINDRFGHAVGDKALCSLVQILENRLRKVDTICRFGGEEFVVLLNETAGALAMQVADELRATVQAQIILPEGEMTISIGVSDVRVAKDLDDWLKLADGALYLAKSSGRNRVEGAAESAVPLETPAKTVPAWR